MIPEMLADWNYDYDDAVSLKLKLSAVVNCMLRYYRLDSAMIQAAVVVVAECDHDNSYG